MDQFYRAGKRQHGLRGPAGRFGAGHAQDGAYSLAPREEAVSHRFYYGKPITGTIWFFTGGLLLIGWIIDLFLIPSMDRRADRRFVEGPIDYSIGFVLLTFVGVFGIHRFYLGKWITGIIYLFTGGFFLIGWLYDFWTLNGQISEINQGSKSSFH